MNILWIDDEIELLKPHLLFLEKKGYSTFTENNATDAIERLPNEHFDAVLIDENMPGMSGLEALAKIKAIRPSLPIVMVTKNEEEAIMEEAIGAHIADYLIKPVNPNQILLSLKKILDSKKIISEKTLENYRQEFRTITMDMMQARDHTDWEAIYKKIVRWEMEMDEVDSADMTEILSSQKHQANGDFFKFISREYSDWMQGEDKPVLSPDVFGKWVVPMLKNEENVLLIMVDNLRYDQWKMIQPLFAEDYNLVSEKMYYSILPTATQYARNAFFAGLYPSEIAKRYPDYWLNDNEEGNKNQFEDQLLKAQLKRNGLTDLKSRYFKILNSDYEHKLLDEFNNFKHNELITMVYNFVDILSHAKTDNKIVNEFIRDDKTFRSVTRNWFENSYLLKIVKLARQEGKTIVLTTDHGTMFVNEPSEVIGDRETSTNLRYKLGKQLRYKERDVLAVHHPEDFHLPKANLSSTYIFAREDVFFAYPKNYNHYVNYYKNTYQHGGVSMEEMIIPFVVLSPKR